MITRPVLRYPGGKYRIADWVISHFPSHNLYVEPFGGAASVLMAKGRSTGEIYNDLNSNVVNVFRVLRDPDQAGRLEELCRLTPFALAEYNAAFEPCDEPIEKARRMIFRSFAGIGSDSIFRNCGFRYSKHNKSGVVPAQGWMRYPEAIKYFTTRLQGVVINNLDAFDIIKKYDSEETLFYLDPPYLSSTRSDSSVLYANEMLGEEQHLMLAGLIKTLKGKVVLSGYASELYKNLYEGFRLMAKSANGGSGNGHGSKRVECLWLSPNIQTTLF